MLALGKHWEVVTSRIYLGQASQPCLLAIVDQDDNHEQPSGPMKQLLNRCLDRTDLVLSDFNEAK